MNRKSPRFRLAFILATAVLASGNSALSPAVSPSLRDEILPPASQSWAGRLPASFVEVQAEGNGNSRYFLSNARFSLIFEAQGITLHSISEDRRIEPLLIRFAGARADCSPRGLGELEGKMHFLRGKDPAKWISGAPTFEKLIYEGIYPGIDLVFDSANGILKSEFRVAPQADPWLIGWSYHPVDGLSLGEDGSLSASSGPLRIVEGRPVAYQPIQGIDKPVTADYVIDQSSVGYWLGPYDKNEWLIIDPPLLVYSSYLSGQLGAQAFAVATDGEGAIYVAGSTISFDFPLQNPLQDFPQRFDLFVTKLDPSGTRLLFSTFLGGEANEAFSGAGLAVGSDGSIYVTAQTDSTDFPVTEGAFDTQCFGPRFNCGDIFVSKLDPSGGRLVYSTYLGGDSLDVSFAIGVDDAGNAYVTGFTTSSDYPTLNAVQDFRNGHGDAILTKLNPEGSQILFSTYLGGRGGDDARALALDPQGRPAIAGSTSSDDFPTLRPIQPFRGGMEGFVTAFDSQGQIRFSTYLGGSQRDEILALSADPSGNLLIAGTTDSTDFPVSNPFQSENRRPSMGAEDAFVTKLSPSGQQLVFSTYLGGAGGFDIAQAIASDAQGNVIVAGLTTSTDFPLANAFQNQLRGNLDAFVSVFEPDGANLLLSTYLGGHRDEQASAVASDATGGIYLAGTSDSADFPLVNAFQLAIPVSGAGSSFVSKLALEQLTRRIWFPLVGAGQDGNRIRFRTEIMLLNASPEATSARIDFFDSAGRPLELELDDQGRAASFELPLQGGQRTLLSTSDSETLKTGYAVVEAGRLLGGTLVFIRSDIPSGSVLYEAGLPSAQPSKRFRVVVDRRQGRNTGLAMVNTEGGTATVQLRLHDPGFRLLAQADLQLSAGEQRSQFVNELFSGFFQDGDEFQGALTVESDRPLAAFTLRQRDAPILDQPPILTVFPVVAFPSIRDR